MVGQLGAQRGIGNRPGPQDRRMGLHIAKYGGKGDIGGVASGAKTHQPHRNGGSRRIKDVPAVAKISLYVGMKIRWA